METLVILDGSCRAEALRRLGCKLAPVCMIDYADSRVTLSRLCLAIPGPFTEGQAREGAGRLGVSFKPHGGGVDPFSFPGLGIVFRDASFRVEARGVDVVVVSRTGYRLGMQLAREGYGVISCTQEEARRLLDSGATDAVIVPPKLCKGDVLDAARSGRLFPPGSTRHAFPARILGVDLPIQILSSEELAMDEANQLLRARLEASELKKLPPGSVLDGKRYEETLYIF